MTSAKRVEIGACLVQVKDAQHTIAGQCQHEPVRQGGLVPGIAEVGVWPQHILPLVASHLPASAHLTSATAATQAIFCEKGLSPLLLLILPGVKAA
jgi:hypothetical protein